MQATGSDHQGGTSEAFTVLIQTLGEPVPQEWDICRTAIRRPFNVDRDHRRIDIRSKMSPSDQFKALTHAVAVAFNPELDQMQSIQFADTLGRVLEMW